MELAYEFDASGFPVSFIERYRTADGPALKVALYLLLGNNPLPEQIADELALPPETVARALDFWLRAGLLRESGAQKPAEKPAPEATDAKMAPVAVERRLPATKLAQCLRNPEVAALLQESQSFLGRALSHNESERLLCIYEFDELPVDVILTIVAYSKKRAKHGLMNYIERVAREWKEDGIDTIARAEEHLKLLAKRERRYRRIAEVLETDAESFTYRDRQYIDRWFEEYGYDGTFAAEAYQRQGNKSVAYINKILKSWSTKGYRTIKETRQEITNTAAPAPERKRKKEKDDLLMQAVLETNVEAGG